MGQDSDNERESIIWPNTHLEQFTGVWWEKDTIISLLEQHKSFTMQMRRHIVQRL